MLAYITLTLLSQNYISFVYPKQSLLLKVLTFYEMSLNSSSCWVTYENIVNSLLASFVNSFDFADHNKFIIPPPPRSFIVSSNVMTISLVLINVDRISGLESHNVIDDKKKSLCMIKIKGVGLSVINTTLTRYEYTLKFTICIKKIYIVIQIYIIIYIISFLIRLKLFII